MIIWFVVIYGCTCRSVQANIIWERSSFRGHAHVTLILFLTILDQSISIGHRSNSGMIGPGLISLFLPARRIIYNKVNIGLNTAGRCLNLEAPP